MNDLKIPVGISDFAKIRNYGYYYVDKTGLISELLEDIAEVTLITRPRRFGKTMGMSMLANFFDIRKDSKNLFQGLEISNHTALCETWQNQWPVVFLSFKNIDGMSFSMAYQQLLYEISLLYDKHSELLDSDRLTEEEKARFLQLKRRTAEEVDVLRSIQFLLSLLHKHYGKPVILLLDEYDVPLAKSSAQGYYPQMLNVIKAIMTTSLKDNDALRFAVITGCLRIAKESIFTGTNNFVSDTISSSHLNEYFGFTQADVDQILRNADLTDHANAVKAWYDGYHFGDLDVYCPWDVMNYLRDLQRNPKIKPASYWKNTSDNAIIRSFIDYAEGNIAEKLETLMSGGCIVQKIREDLTYEYLHSSEENLGSILYATGYLTQVREDVMTETLPPNTAALMIPNAEIREIFEATVQDWFADTAKEEDRKPLFDAVWSGDTETLTTEMNKLLRKTISYHDYREDFYHAFLAGIFTGAGYSVESNREHGEGRSDVLIKNPRNARIAIFEAKYAKKLGDLETYCEAALQQIDKRQYAKVFEEDYDSVLCYGIAFYKKRCLVRMK